MTELFDIVIPVGPNDMDVIKMQTLFTQKYIVGYRNIYLISTNPQLELKGCITIQESIFPFDIKLIDEMHSKKKSTPIHGSKLRSGWFLQQLFKLYAGFIIPNILERYLVIDADTFFLKKTKFIENNKCLYNYSDQYHKPYFIHMSKLDINFNKKYNDKSGICHHMMFEHKYIQEIFDIVEKNHNKEFYKVFLDKVDDVILDGCSEYEIYFNYIFTNHSDSVLIRKLHWSDSNKLLLDTNHDYLSVHHYMRI